MMNNAVDDATTQDDVYYYGDNTYYVAEMDDTDDIDDEYAFYANEIEGKDNYIAKHVQRAVIKGKHAVNYRRCDVRAFRVLLDALVSQKYFPELDTVSVQE